MTLENLAMQLEQIETLMSAYVGKSEERMPDSDRSKCSALNESKEGALVEVPKHLPPGRKTPNSVPRMTEPLICMVTNDMSTSDILWQASPSTPVMSSKSSLQETPREDFGRIHVEIAREAIKWTKLNGSFGPTKQEAKVATPVTTDTPRFRRPRSVRSAEKH